jgi:aspartate 4-decarboxylase
METPSELSQLSPFELKNELIRYAEDVTREKAATHKFLNAGRGNPNWIATTPREAFFLLGQFGIEEARRVWHEPDLGGMPRANGIAERLRDFISRGEATPASRLLQRAIDYGTHELGFDADAFIHELVDATIGDNYPEPDRMLVHIEGIVQRFLQKTMCDDRPPAGRFRLFATEGGTAAMRYVFDSLLENRILRKGDTIALGTPIFTPYVELPQLEDFQFKTVEIAQSEVAADGRHLWQYPEEEIRKLEDPRIKAFFIVNPSNPASFSMAEATQRRIVELVRTKRPDLLILTDDVYGTFAPGFRSLAADLPHNTILVYSYSKHFGATGWRLGVIAMHEDHVVDHMIAKLPEKDRAALAERYHTMAIHPEKVSFIDRMVADSRDVALNHTAGLSTPQQAQMAMFSLFSLLDDDDTYQTRCREIVHERFAKLMEGLGIELPPDAHRVGYYADLDLEVWGRRVIGDDFMDYVAEHAEPIDVVLQLAKRHGTVLLNGSGFAGPPWSVRVSLANLDTESYAAIGRDLKEIVTNAVERWRASKRH